MEGTATGTCSLDWAGMKRSSGSSLLRASRWIADADSLLITAGAGMGVDSGLPDFRGTEGFWRAYPALARSGLHFEQIASPHSFLRQPRLAWGFYGHRLDLYRRTEPHEGFHLLRRWGEVKRHGAFVFTSNVDGQFQKAGFSDDRVCEAHGSIHHLQCLDGCSDEIWPASDFAPRVDVERCELVGEPPRCPSCGAIARPNVLMFGDFRWVSERTDAQHGRLNRWRRAVARPLVIELGAGTTIPTVRWFAERVGCRYVRINLREPEVPDDRGIGLQGGALAVLRQLGDLLGEPN